MASREPMPRYFFSLMPSEKKYSPGASLVAANREPIITGHGEREELVCRSEARRLEIKKSLNWVKVRKKLAFCFFWHNHRVVSNIIQIWKSTVHIIILSVTWIWTHDRWPQQKTNKQKKHLSTKYFNCTLLHTETPIYLSIPVDAPSARALAMCPTVWMPPSAITGTPKRLAYSDTL